MKPNSKNACGGNFQDWLEVNLTDICNAKCEWCVEKSGWHPKTHVDWRVIAGQAVNSGNKNIILLGGEPTLYRHLKEIVASLVNFDKNVWITTHGGFLTPDFIRDKLQGVTGVNISIHDHDLNKNKDITGIDLRVLEQSISTLHEVGASVRLNCNCIKGHVDSIESILEYINFAKKMGADKIRFAELKQDDGKFVDLTKVFNNEYGTNDDPFTLGCNSDVVINDMPINIRQMCGLQTSMRPMPENPVQLKSKVLYYDGKMYDGWQITKKEKAMDDRKLKALLKNVADGLVSVEVAADQIQYVNQQEVGDAKEQSGDGCVY